MTDFSIKKRLSRAHFRTIKYLQEYCGYFVTKTLSSGISQTFDYLCESPFLEYEKDAGALVKVVLDYIDESALQAIRDFKTKRKKELWVYTKKLSIFKFEGSELIYPRNEALLLECIKPVSNEKSPAKVSQKDKKLSQIPADVSFRDTSLKSEKSS